MIKLYRYLIICLTVLAVTPQSAFAIDEDPQPTPMGSSLLFPKNATQINLGSAGVWGADFALTGFALGQNNSLPDNNDTAFKFSNLQIIVQKKDGPLKFYTQAGAYSTLVIGKSYDQALRESNNTFGYVPLAYFTYEILPNWNVQLGKLSSLGGYESTFTYQNLNVQRGLLWDQTSSVSYGAQINYSDEKMTASLSWTDGFYSNRMNWFGAAVGYEVADHHRLSASFVGAVSGNPQNSDTTPLLQNNSQISNLIYQYESDRWLIAPYLQYTQIPMNQSIGILSNYSTMGAAVLINYKMPLLANNSELGKSLSVPLRIEYLKEQGGSAASQQTLFYGPNSRAWTFTLTPTLQFKRYFARLEGSYIQTINPMPGLTFGANGMAKSQVRGLLEVGILY